MHFSQEGTNLLKDIEQLGLEPYDDQTGKQINTWVKGATIGYGHLIHKSEWHLYKNTITQTQAEQLFKEDIAPFVKAVNEAITVALQQNQFDALLLLAYNIGVDGFKSCSAVKLVNDPNANTAYPTLEDAWKAWNRSGGQVMQGLINRRNAECKLYTQAIYAKW
ncbi:MAG: lysozyme [Nitrococcus sp.]|nr:lysozyme [Nitrococcus sp.]